MAFMWERKGNKSSLTEFKWKGGGGNHSKLTTNEDGGEEGSLEHYRAVLGVG